MRKIVEIPWSKSEESGSKIPHSQLRSSAAILFESNLLPSKSDILRSRCILKLVKNFSIWKSNWSKLASLAECVQKRVSAVTLWCRCFIKLLGSSVV